jgi:hypothetical protein
MAANAQVTGIVEYRAGDGPLITIPQGPVEVQMSIDSAVLSWGDQGEVQSAAIPTADFERYVREGLITLRS